jgi:hypothetical protein
MINEYAAVGGMRIGRGNRSTWRKLASLPLFPPQTSHDLTRAGDKPACGTEIPGIEGKTIKRMRLCVQLWQTDMFNL